MAAILEEIKGHLSMMETRIAFTVDSESDELLVKVLDRETGEVIRQIPPEEIHKIRTAFRDLVSGILFDRQA